MDTKFVDATIHGFLEKMTTGWRGFFSSSAKVTWVKYYFVLRNETLYLFVKDNYDKPVESINLELFTLEKEPAKKTKYNKEWVMELERTDESPICLAAPDEEMFRKWNQKIVKAIEFVVRGF